MATRKQNVTAVFTSQNLYDQDEVVARWNDDIERIVVELGHTMVQMRPGAARHLAHQLLAAEDAAEGALAQGAAQEAATS